MCGWKRAVFSETKQVMSTCKPHLYKHQRALIIGMLVPGRLDAFALSSLEGKRFCGSSLIGESMRRSHVPKALFGSVMLHCQLRSDGMFWILARPL